MRVIKARDRMQGDVRPPNGRFHGRATQHLLHQTAEDTRESFVSFDPGAHTHWHVHSGGQLLHILEGNARAQAWGEAVNSLSAGDTAITPPGEKHWHGATADGPMTQLAITSGEVTWLEDAQPNNK
jgi:quercetin dioxygenase-like cupin family protein